MQTIILLTVTACLQCSNNVERSYFLVILIATIPIVMVLTGIDLIFFIEAHIMLSFRFLMKIVVITHHCFSCC